MNSPAVKLLAVTALFVVVGIGIYSNSLEVPFHFDGIKRIKENPDVRMATLTLTDIGNAASSKYSSRNRPTGNITFALNYYFHQYHLLGYHIVNITIHILTGVFLFFFIKTTVSIARKPPAPNTSISASLHPATIALFSALLWLVNPVQTQSVTYIVQRLNSMAAMFYVLSFLLYVQGRMRLEGVGERETRNSRSKIQNPKSKIQECFFWYVGSFLAWILALGSKQNTATLPFFIILYEWYFFQNLSKEWVRRNVKYFVGALILFALIAFMYLGVDPWERISRLNDFAKNEFTLSERVLTQFRVVIYYLSLVMYPHPSRLNLDYDFPLSHSLVNPATTLLCLFAIVGLVGLAIYLAKRERLVSFCILWFFGNLIIESSIIPLAIIFEHRVYLPSMLVSLAAVCLVHRITNLESLKVVLLFTGVVVLSLWTYERNKVWSDEIILWRDCADKSPQKVRPHNNLGVLLNRRGDHTEGMQHFSEALRVKPDHAEVHHNLGIALANQGNFQEAAHHFSEAVRIKPEYAEAHHNLGLALADQGRVKEAARSYEEALRIKADHGDAHYNLGLALASQGKLKKATHHYREALRVNPGHAEGHYNLANALLKQGKLQEARHHYTEALRIKPKFTEAHCNLGAVLLSQGKLEEAISHYTEAIRIKPDSAEAYYNLGNVLLSQRKVDEALHNYREALRIEPSHRKARERLDAVLRALGKGKEKGSGREKP